MSDTESLEDWEKEDFDDIEVPKGGAVNNEWEGEDEEEEEDTQRNTASGYEEYSTEELIEALKQKDKTIKDLRSTKPKGGKKALKKAIKEKEEAERRRRDQEEAAIAEEEKLTPEEKFAKKLQDQKKVEEADLELAKELFSDEQTNVVLIEAMEPSTVEEFADFRTAILKKVEKYAEHVLYNEFVAELIKQLCIDIPAESLRQISKDVNVLSNEKTKAEKGNKKKKSNKKSLGGGRIKGGDDFGTFDDDLYDDFI